MIWLIIAAWLSQYSPIIKTSENFRETKLKKFTHKKFNQVYKEKRETLFYT